MTHYNQTITEILEGVGDLAEWMSRRFNVAMATPYGNTTGVECPAHRPGHTDSANVTRWPNGRQTFKCWRCDIGPFNAGDLLVALGEAHDFGAALKLLSGPSPYHAARRPTKSLPRPAVTASIEVPPNNTFLNPRWDETPKGEALCRYLAWRGWSCDTARLFSLEAVVQYGHWRARHPFYLDGGVVTYQDYSPAADVKQRWLSAKGGKLCLYGIQTLHTPSDSVALVEGVSDTLTMWEVTHSPAVGVPGASSFTEQMAHPLEGRPIRVWADNDLSGQKLREKVDATYTGPVKHHYYPQQFKDLSQWRLSDPNFEANFREVAK